MGPWCRPCWKRSRCPEHALTTTLRSAWITSFLRTAKPDSNGRAIIRPRSIYILPTKQGMVLALVLILMLIGSINYGSNLGYLVTFLFGGVWLTTILRYLAEPAGVDHLSTSGRPRVRGSECSFQTAAGKPEQHRVWHCHHHERGLRGCVRPSNPHDND